MKKTKHIGIVACSYEGAALCYKTVCNEGATVMGEHAHPEISLHTHPLSEYMDFIYRDDWNGVAALMRSSAEKLVEIGAEILICPDNTIHRVFDSASQGISAAWLHIAREVAAVAKRENYKKTGILGTKYLMESEVYPQAFGARSIGYEIPDEPQRIEINRIIFDELVYGVIKETSRDYFLQVIEDLKTKGCDSVVLGCTEIPLIVLPEDSPLPVLDSTRILARAALSAATEEFRP
jgi:aspartate racemase